MVAGAFRRGLGDLAWNDRVEPHRRDVAVNGLDLHCIDPELHNSEDLAPVLLVHGYADSTYCWHQNVEALRQARLRPILLDQPGLGRSSLPADSHIYSVENQAAAVLGLADALSLDRFHVVGHSMGGGLALYLALHHPDRLCQVVVITPPCFHPPQPPMLALPGMELWAPLVAGRWAVQTALREAYLDARLVTSRLVDEYARPLSTPGRMRVLSALARDYFSLAFNEMIDRYAELACPLLIVWGDRDPWVPVEFGEALRAQVQGARLEVIDRTGHLPHQERPDAVNPLLVAFLAGS